MYHGSYHAAWLLAECSSQKAASKTIVFIFSSQVYWIVLSDTKMEAQGIEHKISEYITGRDIQFVIGTWVTTDTGLYSSEVSHRILDCA
jgi:hypothetical protein